MIVNFHFTNFTGNALHFEGPLIMLERNQNYVIALRHIHVELKSNQIRHDQELWSLKTNLVDRTPTNPKQCISYFNTTKGKLNQSSISTSLVFYPLELHHLENPKFYLQKIAEDQQLALKNVLLQLEIKRCSDFQNH